MAAIDNLAQELCRRAKAATVDRARAAVHAWFTVLDDRVRAALHRHGGCARWGHDFRQGRFDSEHWISKPSGDGHGHFIMARCIQCRLWHWNSDYGWKMTGERKVPTGDGASRTCHDCKKDCPADYPKCPRCGAEEAPAAEVGHA